jgi:hypothetical protein
MRRNGELIALLAVLLVPLAANRPACADPPLETSENERDRQFDAMIDSLANRVNTAPTIKQRGPYGPVFFHEDYDYDEQQRVLKALQELNGRDGNELWPRLVAHLDDKRYGFTYEGGAGVPHNMAVGDLCMRIARGDLEYACLRISPIGAGLNGPRPLVVRPTLGEDDALGTWCKKRKDKQLYELQIEVCEWRITSPEALQRLSAEQIDEYVKKAKAQIESQKKARVAFTDKERFDSGWYSPVSKRRIKEYRDGPEKSPRLPGFENLQKKKTDEKPNPGDKSTQSEAP